VESVLEHLLVVRGIQVLLYKIYSMGRLLLSVLVGAVEEGAAGLEV
jgi:hypothetical protein